MGLDETGIRHRHKDVGDELNFDSLPKKYI